jgi:hypothetical protein
MRRLRGQELADFAQWSSGHGSKWNSSVANDGEQSDRDSDIASTIRLVVVCHFTSLKSEDSDEALNQLG